MRISNLMCVGRNKAQQDGADNYLLNIVNLCGELGLTWDHALWCHCFWYLLWQPLITKTNDHTSGKSLSWISSGKFTRELDKESLLN